MAVLPIRADDLRLIAILDGGTPAFCAGEMPAAARDVLEGTALRYADEGFTPPWIGYLALCGGEIVGSCAFVTPPRDGVVEIAFQTFEHHEGRGVATAMVQRLLGLAYRNAPSSTVAARTPAREGAATRVLRKLDFRLRDCLRDPQDGVVWLWQRGVAA
ncbi:GNAT family N-acetyltransferase [Solimonas soli]|uniref:GNAT family N-acetyltransferase n=1 Tax=Solimonas soli TaxID=413479 RepID=UPI0004B7227A|nr:GNAT family N-acetyltransferase [Solimonas soli]